MRKERIKIEGLQPYLVTESGIVISDWGRHKGHEMSVHRSNNGYAKCTLQRVNGGSYPILMHRIMAETFIPNPHKLPHVNHKDSDRMNYQLDNLEWCTVSENIQHGLEFGNIPKGHECSFASLTQDIVIEAYMRMLEGQRVIDVSRSMGIPRPILTNIKSRRSYSYTTKDLPDIEVKKTNKPLSEATVRWVANRLSEGKTNSEIVAESNNKLITPSMVSRIRRRVCFASLTSEYKW